MENKLINLDWKVKKVNLKDSETNEPTPYFANKRMDSGKYLGTVSSGYHIVQNSELLDIMNRICENTGYELFMEKELNEGKQVIISLKTGEFNIAGFDKGIKQISMTNSFNGTSAAHLSFLDLVHRCKNEFKRVIKNSMFSWEHDSLMNMKMENTLQKIKVLNKYQDKHYDNLEKFVSTKFSKDLAIKQIQTTLDIPMILNDTLDSVVDYANISTRKKNIMDSFINCYEKEQKDLGETLYTMYNAGTRYATNVLKKPYTGSGLKISNDFYNKALSIVTA